MTGLVDIVEGMKKFFLSGALSGDELNIVDKEEVDVSLLHAEVLDGAVLYGFDHLICKIVALYIGKLF